MVTRYRPEIRERMVTVYRDVPTTETIQEEYTVMVPETRTRTVADTINHPVYGDIQLRTTTMTPAVECVKQRRRSPGWSPCKRSEPCASVGRLRWRAPAAPPSEPIPAASPPGADAGGRAAAACCNSCNACPRKVCVTCWKPVCQQVDSPVSGDPFPARFAAGYRLVLRVPAGDEAPRRIVRGPGAGKENADAADHRDADGSRATAGTIHGDGPLSGAASKSRS